MKKFYSALVRTNSQARLGEWASGITKVTHSPRHPLSEILVIRKIRDKSQDNLQRKNKDTEEEVYQGNEITIPSSMLFYH